MRLQQSSLPPAKHSLLLNTQLTIRYSLFTIRYSLFAIRYSLFAIRYFTLCARIPGLGI